MQCMHCVRRIQAAARMLPHLADGAATSLLRVLSAYTCLYTSHTHTQTFKSLVRSAREAQPKWPTELKWQPIAD
jgi:hypothetical protein